MRFIKILLKTILLFTLLISSVSCHGQNGNLPESNPRQTTGTNLGHAVAEIGTTIRSIFQDSKGNLWFGTDGEGVYRYDGKNILLFTNKDGLSQNQVLSIQEDRKGVIYFETGGGICCFNGQAFTALKPNPENQPDDISGNEWQKNHEDLWFAGPKGSVYRYDGHLLHCLQFPKNTLEEAYYSKYPNTPISPYSVYCIYKDRKGNVWFGTEYLGVCRFDGKSFAWISEKELGGFAVRSLFEDRNGKYWFGNSAIGLFQFDGKNLTNYTAAKGIGDFKDKNGETRTSIMAISDDDTGALWIATYGAGVWRYDGKNNTNYTIKEGLTSNEIMTVYKDPKGMLWFGTKGGGVCTFNGRTFEKFKL